jgi:hypothetical protein
VVWLYLGTYTGTENKITQTHLLDILLTIVDAFDLPFLVLLLLVPVHLFYGDLEGLPAQLPPRGYKALLNGRGGEMGVLSGAATRRLLYNAYFLST